MFLIYTLWWKAAPVKTIDMLFVHSLSYFQQLVLLSHICIRDGNPTILSGNSLHT